MYVDKASKEIAVKVACASEGNDALAAVSTLAAQAKPGTASAVIARLNESVRTFTLSMPAIQVRGLGLRVEVVAVSLAALRTGSDEPDVSEKTILRADALIFVVGANEPTAKATFARIRAVFQTLGLNGAQTPLALIDPRAELGVNDVPVVAAPVAALQAVIKPMVQNIITQLGN